MLEASGIAFHLIENPENKGVAGSWNQIARYAWQQGCGWALICNDDVVMGKGEGDLVSFCEAESTRDDGPRFFVCEKAWCSFLLPKPVWDTVGEFDEQFFPAYFEDNDYAERLLRAGKPHQFSSLLYPSVFRSSQTIAKDGSLNANYDRNEARFLEKWGAEVFFRLVTR